MTILLLGSGGREHAFAWKMIQSPLCEKLFVAPGNAGTAAIATNVAMSPTDFDAIKAFVIQENVKMVVVGPEDPLVKGIYDYFKNDESLQHIPVIGPSKSVGDIATFVAIAAVPAFPGATKSFSQSGL